MNLLWQSKKQKAGRDKSTQPYVIISKRLNLTWVRREINDHSRPKMNTILV